MLAHGLTRYNDKKYPYCISVKYSVLLDNNLGVHTFILSFFYSQKYPFNIRSKERNERALFLYIHIYVS